MRQVLNLSCVSAVVMLQFPEATMESPGLISRTWRRFRRTLFPDRSIIPLGHAPGPHADDPEQIGDLLNGIPMVEMKTGEPGAGSSMRDIEALGLDVLLDFSQNGWPDSEPVPAKWGVWSLVFGDPDGSRNGPPGVWEVIDGDPVTCCSLVMSSGHQEASLTLHKSYSATVPWSIGASRNLMLWQIAASVPRKIRELHRYGAETFFARARAISGAMKRRPPFTMPGRRELTALVRRQKRRHREELRVDAQMMRQWILLYDLGAPELATRLSHFKRLAPPPDRIWADPFIVRKNNLYYVFLEEHLKNRAYGHIAVQVMNDEGPVGMPEKVLERPYHLSYPFLFESGENLFMVPETKGNHAVELYRCVEFPHRWEFCRTMLNGIEAVDATLWQQGGDWWMFTGIVQSRGAYSWTELHLYHTGDPVIGEWKPHPLNPVVTDVRSARPAGNLFMSGGKLYRPAQDGSVGYGYGIRIHEVLTLTPDAYEEREVTFIPPDWATDLCGTHTINHVGKLTVADARILRPKA